MAGQTLNQKIVQWATGKTGQPVGAGRQCWDLADKALRTSGAKGSADLGPMGTDADYVWGDEIDLKDAIPGDVLQYRDFDMTIVTTTETTFDDGYVEIKTQTANETHPHHTAIVANNAGGGAITVLEQNYRGKKEHVKANPSWWKSATPTPVTSYKRVTRKDNKKTELATVVVSVDIAVSGTITAYRPTEK